MLKPKFSIFTCSYNNPGNIAVAISSILRQTIPEFEYFIIDSSDDGLTPGIIKEFEDPRIILIKDENHSEAFLKNKYFPYAKGQYIAVLSDNDIMMTNSFTEHLNTFNSNRNIRATYHGMEIFYTDNNKPNSRFLPERMLGKFLSEDKWTENELDLESGSIMFQSSLLSELKKTFFDENLSKNKSEHSFVKNIAEAAGIYPVNWALHIERRTIEDDQN